MSNPANEILDSAFPFMRQDIAKSQTMDGAEALNRAQGEESSNEAHKPGKTGRPRKKGTPLEQFNHASPAPIVKIESGKVVAGSVIAFNGKAGIQFAVLTSSCLVEVLPMHVNEKGEVIYDD